MDNFGAGQDSDVKQTTGLTTSIAGAPTSIAAFIGWTARGPADHPALVRSWSEFEQLYGGLDAQSGYLPHAVNQFYLNGGQQAYIVRLPGEGPAISPEGSSKPAASCTAPYIAAALDLLAKIDLFNLLCFPGETSSGSIRALEQYCRSRRAFLIADSDPDVTDPSAVSPPASVPNAALYFPWVLCPDPNQNRPRAFPPSGFVAGIYAQTDQTRGVWKAPAGTQASLKGAAGVAVALNDSQASMLNSNAVNTIRSVPGAGVLVWGARTTQGTEGAASEWTYVPVRRMALFIEESLYRGLQWVVFEPNGEPLWARIRVSVEAFLQQLFAQGAFQGSTPAQAWFVKCDSTTITQNDINSGLVNIVVGFAPLKPAEFVVICIQMIAAKP